MTREELTALAETAETRTKGYLRAALADPEIKAAVHSRYVPAVLRGPGVANDHRGPSKSKKRA
ncbi:hypothetical protein [Methylobacterium sp. A54F]